METRKFEIYEKVEPVKPEPEPVRWTQKMRFGGDLEVEAVDKGGYPLNHVLRLIPGKGIRLSRDCNEALIGMPVDEKGRVKIVE